MQLEKLGNNVKEPVSQLKFIIEAWQQVNSNTIPPPPKKRKVKRDTP